MTDNSIPKANLDSDSMPNDRELTLKLAFELKEQGRFNEAIDQFQKIVAYYEEDPQVVLMIAMLMVIELKQYELALKYALRAVELLPNHEQASLTLFHCYFDQGLQDEAEDEITRYVKTGSAIEKYQVLFDENGLTVEDFK